MSVPASRQTAFADMSFADRNGGSGGLYSLLLDEEQGAGRGTTVTSEVSSASSAANEGVAGTANNADLEFVQEAARRAVHKFTGDCQRCVLSLDKVLHKLAAAPGRGSDADVQHAEVTAIVREGMRTANKARSALARLRGAIDTAPAKAGVESAERTYDALIVDFERSFKPLDDGSQRALRMMQRSAISPASSRPGPENATTQSGVRIASVTTGGDSTAAQQTTAGGMGDSPFGDADSISRDNVLQEQMSRQVLQEAVAFHTEDLQAREQGLSHLRDSVTQLNEVYRNVAVLVEEQGESVNQIEQHAERAQEHTHNALQELYKTAMYQRRVNPFACWFMVILVITATVLLSLLAAHKL